MPSLLAVGVLIFVAGGGEGVVCLFIDSTILCKISITISKLRAGATSPRGVRMLEHKRCRETGARWTSSATRNTLEAAMNHYRTTDDNHVVRW